MSNELDDSLRPHLSALVDGELEPLEAIALQRHLRHQPELAGEYRDLERLKLSVHLAGRRDDPDPALRQRLLAALHEQAGEAEDKRRRRRWAAPLAAVAMAAAALLIAVPLMSGGGDEGAAESVVLAEYDLTETALARLIAVHTGELPPLGLRDMELSGALLTLETLPGGFIATGAERSPGIIQASHEACSERAPGATIAVLRADRIELPAGVSASLEAAGAYEDNIDGVSVKLSARGDKIFVLIDDGGGFSSDPI